MNLIQKDIAIDMGTTSTLVFEQGKGIVMREPSVVAVDVRNDTVLAVGTKAKEMIGRTPGSIVAVRPLKDGVIADFDITATMLKHFIKKVLKNNGGFGRPRIVVKNGEAWQIACPSGRGASPDGKRKPSTGTEASFLMASQGSP